MLRQAWIFKCRRKNYNLTKHSRICEKHFNDSDFLLSRAFAASVGYSMNFQLQLHPMLFVLYFLNQKVKHLHEKGSYRKDLLLGKN